MGREREEMTKTVIYIFLALAQSATNHIQPTTKLIKTQNKLEKQTKAVQNLKKNETSIHIYRHWIRKEPFMQG